MFSELIRFNKEHPANALLGKLFTKEGMSQVGGPVAMYRAADTFASQGFFMYCYYLAMISINLGIVNLLPLPALDGGLLIFILLETITRKKLDPKIENTINMIGMLLLFGFMILVTLKDIFFPVV